MSSLLGAATALFLDWWASRPGRWRLLSLLLAGGATVAGGTGVGRWLAVGIPPVGASLLGSGVLGCLGLVHLAESVGPGRAGLDADCELLVRSLLAATGTALMASNPVRALAVSLGGLLAGLGAAAIGSRTRPFWRGMRLLAGLLLLGLCFFTFRGAT